MAETVPVRCPVCRREHLYAPAVYPCVCGAPTAPPLERGAPPEPITHRTWTDDWVTVRCQECGRRGEWPQPELGCPCGTVLRIPVRPVTIRTAHDAVTAAVLCLKSLGFRDVVQPEVGPASGVDLRGAGVVARVDSSTRPTSVREVECLWLNGLSSSVASVFFSLTGYTDDAWARAGRLGIPLFVMDLAGSPRPVNEAADELISNSA
ncbi:hypothetical protein ACIHCQ_26880 [Streptomyces sp. NPDC052236]|uniref:hypothetical protein n=1 Tax=Streptomyces sp. NPDC052236 TaxID=3365686 RepID=UPI0037CE1E16